MIITEVYFQYTGRFQIAFVELNRHSKILVHIM